MPHFLAPDKELTFEYDLASSTAENRFVSSVHQMVGQNASIVIPSGTAGFELWANNSKPYNRAVPVYQSNFDTQYEASMAKFNNEDVSFSGNWVNITNAPFVEQSGYMFTLDAPIRFIRLQGSSVSGSVSAEIGYFYSADMGPMI